MSITSKESEEQSDNVTVASKVDKLEASKKYWKNHYFNPVLDSIIIYLKNKFSEESQTLANSTENFFKLEYDG